MVPTRVTKQDERLTGNWWLEVERGWFGRSRIHVMVEVSEGWGTDTPPMPGMPKQLDWRAGARRATEYEISIIRFAHLPAFQYAPHLLGLTPTP